MQFGMLARDITEWHAGAAVALDRRTLGRRIDLGRGGCGAGYGAVVVRQRSHVDRRGLVEEAVVLGRGRSFWILLVELKAQTETEKSLDSDAHQPDTESPIKQVRTEK